MEADQEVHPALRGRAVRQAWGPPSVLVHARADHCGRREEDPAPACGEAYYAKMAADAVPAAAEACSEETDYVLVHDAALAFVPDSEVQNEEEVRHEVAAA